MPRDNRESDWKLFRALQTEWLERFCERTLTEVHALSVDASQSFHQRYLAVYRRIRDRDYELAGAFNDPRRSTMLQQLVALRSLGLIRDDEMSRFSQEVQETVADMLRFSRSRRR